MDDNRPSSSRVVTRGRGTLADLVRLYDANSPALVQLITAQDDEQFASAFYRLLERAVNHLERNKRDFRTLGETGLTAVVVAGLSVPPFLETRQEENTNGHVDLTIETPSCRLQRRILGEAKIYNGPSYHMKGLDQLVGRYSTGRESRALILMYVRKPEIAQLIEKLEGAMNAERPQRQSGTTVAHSLKWAFTSTHVHSSGAHIEVVHVGCNLYVEESNESGSLEGRAPGRSN